MASFDLDFLASPEDYKNIFFAGDFVLLIDIENSIDLIVYFLLRDRRMSQVGVKKVVAFWRCYSVNPCLVCSIALQSPLN